MAAKIGVAFPDYIHLEKHRKPRSYEFADEVKSENRARKILPLTIFVE